MIFLKKQISQTYLMLRNTNLVFQPTFEYFNFSPLEGPINLMEEINMGSPQKRRRKRAIQNLFSLSAPLDADQKARVKDSSFLPNLIKYQSYAKRVHHFPMAIYPDVKIKLMILFQDPACPGLKNSLILTYPVSRASIFLLLPSQMITAHQLSVMLL